MADLLNPIKGYKEEMQKEDMFVVFWRDGRYANDSWSCGWSAESFMREEGYLDLRDKQVLEEILSIDSLAIAVPYYHENFVTGEKMTDMTLNELFAEVLHLYSENLCTLNRFLERQKINTAQIEEIKMQEKLKDAADGTGLLFSTKFYEGGMFSDEDNPYVYDGSMSVEDFRLRSQLIELDENMVEGIGDFGESDQESEDKEIKATMALKL